MESIIVDFKQPMAAPALKNPREMGGGGILTYFVNLKLYPTNFMPFFVDNFCRLLRFGGGDKFKDRDTGGPGGPWPPQNISGVATVNLQ